MLVVLQQKQVLLNNYSMKGGSITTEIGSPVPPWKEEGRRVNKDQDPSGGLSSSGGFSPSTSLHPSRERTGCVVFIRFYFRVVAY